MCSGFKPKARFYWLLGLKKRHFYAVPGTAGKSSSADKPRGSAEALENSRIFSEPYRELNSKMPLPLQAVLARMGRILIQGSALTIPIRRNRTLGAGQTL